MQFVRFFASACALALSVATVAEPLTPALRREILDAARPVAAKQANQPVRFKVDRINVDSGWAMLIGELASPVGGKLDWEQAGCNPDLDKMLWVVLHKTGGAWHVKHIELCASEPPYWYLDEQYGGLVWPCGVYAGIERGHEKTIEEECRELRAEEKAEKDQALAHKVK